MLFWGVLDPFLDLKGIKIFFFTNIYVYNYFLGQTKPFATSNRDRLDTPKINLNVPCRRDHNRVLEAQARPDLSTVHGAKVHDGSVPGGGRHDVHSGEQQEWGCYRTSRNLNMND